MVKRLLVKSSQPITVAGDFAGDNASELGGTSQTPFRVFHNYPSFGLSIIWIILCMGLCSQTAQCVAQLQRCKAKTN